MPRHHDTFDVIIVGAGPAGLFAAHHLSECSSLRVLIVEKGRDVPQRLCPIKKNLGCMHCVPCNILSGVGGAGLFSDGKLNYIHKLGKTDLTQFMGREQAEALILETEAIFNRYGMDGRVYPTDMEAAREIRKRAKKYGIDLLIIRQKHLGSDMLPQHIGRLTQAIKDQGVVVHTMEEAREVRVARGQVTGLVTDKAEYRTVFASSSHPGSKSLCVRTALRVAPAWSATSLDAFLSSLRPIHWLMLNCTSNARSFRFM